MFKKTPIVLLLIMIAPILVLADEVAENNYTYQFHLYYSGQELILDKDFEFSYDIIAGEYNQGGVGQNFYRGEIINLLGKVSVVFQFPVPERVGKVSVRAPYVSDGDEAIIYNSQNRKVLSIDISESSFCNDDGVCQDSRGENNSSCPNDCKEIVQSSSTPTPDLIKKNTGGGLLISLILLVIGGIIGFLIYRRIKNKQITTK